MGKKGLSDKVRNKQKNKSKQQHNPFEVKVNRVKHSVVNKKIQKWEKGVPGVSRSKAVKKRKETLLRELHHLKKSNSLLDKRFGENDNNLTADEKMVQRFALEKKKQMRKSDFNLNDEEDVLTHYGQSLAENLQDTIGSDSDDDENGQLRTGDLQFGGFSKDGDPVSWKDKMKDVIADSKKEKYERQAEKEKTIETTNELDSSWKSVIYKFKPVAKANSVKKPTNYMQLFHSIILEQKTSGGTDKLKTEEEKAKEEAEKLQILEAERLSRMNGSPQKTIMSHVSADDLNDGFALDKPKSRVSFIDAEVTEFPDEKDVEGEFFNKGDTSVTDENVDEESAEENEEVEIDTEDESENYSDIASEDESGNEEEEDEKKSSSSLNKSTNKDVKPILKKQEGQVLMEAGKDITTLPFVFTAPGSFEELEALLHGHAVEEQLIIISRLRKCHHPSLAEGNKEKLENIQLYLLQYFGTLVSQQPICQKLVDNLTVHLWELTQMFKVSTATALQEYIKERQMEYSLSAQKKGGKGAFVEIEVMMHLVLVEILFPTSDFRHPVTTPALHFITQMLTECPVRSGRDVVSGLFLCSLTLKFVSLSKRFVPEVVTFLHGLLCLSSAKDGKPEMMFPPFRAASKSAAILVVKKTCFLSKEELQGWSLSNLLSVEPVTLEEDNFRCQAVSRTLDLIKQCMLLWEDLPCLSFAMEPLGKSLAFLPKQNYPDELKDKIELLSLEVEKSKKKKLKVLQQPSKKPVPLKLFEPKIAEFWSGKKKKGGPNREVNERQRLTHKYKREMKAAVREIKRDSSVLAKHQLDSMMQKDAERKRKTQELMHSLASQEGDYKAIQKKKK